MSNSDEVVRALVAAVDRLTGKVAALSAYVAHLPPGHQVEAGSVKRMALALAPSFAGPGGNSPTVSSEIIATVDQLCALSARAKSSPSAK